MSKCFDANFTFRYTSSGEVIKLIKTLNVKEAYQKIDIPTKIMKLHAAFSEILYVRASVNVLKRVNFHVFLNILLYQYIGRK